ncbi:MAG: hypothetical protein ACSHX6_07080 [Akkermansiaceae bacterium]
MNSHKSKPTLIERDVLGKKDHQGNTIKMGKGFRADDLSEKDLEEQEPLPELEDQWSEQKIEFLLKSKVARFAILLLTLLLIAGIWGFLNLRKERLIKEQRAKEIAKQELAALKSAKDKKQRIAAIHLCVKSYLEAHNKEERVIWCRNPDVTLFKMTQHYNKPNNHFQRYKLSGNLNVSKIHINGKSLELVNARCTPASTNNKPPIETKPLLLEKQTDGSYRIDWETDVVYQGADWDVFTKTKNIEPHTFRVEIRDKNNTGPYLYQFSDENTFQAYRVNIRNEPNKYLIAYARKNSITNLNIRRTLAIDNLIENDLTITSPKPFAPMILKLAFPSQPQSNKCVEIVEVVSDSWFAR